MGDASRGASKRGGVNSRQGDSEEKAMGSTPSRQQRVTATGMRIGLQQATTVVAMGVEIQSPNGQQQFWWGIMTVQ